MSGWTIYAVAATLAALVVPLEMRRRQRARHTWGRTMWEGIGAALGLLIWTTIAALHGVLACGLALGFADSGRAWAWTGLAVNFLLCLPALGLVRVLARR